MTTRDGLIYGLSRHFLPASRQDFHSFVTYLGVDGQGNPLCQRPIDQLMWEFIEETHARGQPAGVMLPMGFGKTTQMIYRAAWEIGRNPNALISIVTDSEDNSATRVAAVRRILDLPRYRQIFPHVRVLMGKDERHRFTVSRAGLAKDPTCSGWGVLGGGAGLRTDFLIFDDVVTQRNALQEPANRSRVEESIRLTWTSRANLYGKAPSRIAWIQTAYHCADAAARLREDPESGWRWLVVRACEPYEELLWETWEGGEVVGTGAVATPYPAEALAERARRMGPTNAARALENRPLSAKECPFKDVYFQSPAPLAPDGYRRRVLFADPAGDATRLKSNDPDYCAVVVIGLREEGNWEVYVADRMRGSPLEQAAFIARKVVQAKAQVIYQEAVKDEALVETTQRELRKLGCYVAVRPEKPSINKEIRIVQTLEPALAGSPPLLRVCGRLFPELRDEALTFPVGAHDDLLDGLAGAFANAGTRAESRIATSLSLATDEHARLDVVRRRQARERRRVELERRREQWRRDHPDSVFGPPF